MLEHVSVITIMCHHGRPQTKKKVMRKSLHILLQLVENNVRSLLLDPIGKMRTLWGRLFQDFSEAQSKSSHPMTSQKLVMDPIGKMRTLWGHPFKVSVKLSQKVPTPA
jgi:hypothetical protein